MAGDEGSFGNHGPIGESGLSGVGMYVGGDGLRSPGTYVEEDAARVAGDAEDGPLARASRRLHEAGIVFSCLVKASLRLKLGATKEEFGQNVSLCWGPAFPRVRRPCGPPEQINLHKGRVANLAVVFRGAMLLHVPFELVSALET